MARLLHLAAAVALGGLATAGLTACTGDGETVPTTAQVVTEVSETPSPTPTLTAEEELLAQIPDDARLEDDAGSINFSIFIVNESQSMLSDLDPALFEFLSQPDCGFCQNQLATRDNLEAQGQTAQGGEVTFDIDSIDGGRQPDGSWNVSVDIEVAAQQYVDASGSVVKELPPENLRVGIGLLYVEDHFELIDVSQ